jgi:hypothetical protein
MSDSSRTSDTKRSEDSSTEAQMEPPCRRKGSRHSLAYSTDHPIHNSESSLRRARLKQKPNLRRNFWQDTLDIERVFNFHNGLGQAWLDSRCV